MSEEKEQLKTKKVKKAKKATLKEQLKEANDKYLRKVAELENFRKRSVNSVQDVKAFAKLQTIEEFLNIYDTFKMAMQASGDSNVNLDMLLAGLNMIQNEFSRTFTNLGVEEINITPGDEFNPQFHEAVTKEYSSEFEDGKIIRQQRCGYKLGEKLVRPVTIVVSQGEEEEKEDKS